MSVTPREDKTHDGMAGSHRPHTVPQRNSLRLLTTTPYIPVPPSLQKSPHLTSIFNHGVASPTLPSEEDEKWLQDTIPLPSREHIQEASSSVGQSSKSGRIVRRGSETDLTQKPVTGKRCALVNQKGAVPLLHSHQHTTSGCDIATGCGLGETTANHQIFIPPSLAFMLDSSWTLCRRRWSTGLLRPPNSDKTFSMSGN